MVGPAPTPPAAAAAEGTTEPNEPPLLVQVRGILRHLAHLGLDPAAELKAASLMPAKGRYPARAALDPIQLTGKWAAVTLTALRMRLAEAQAEHERHREPERPVVDPRADVAWTQVLDELTLAERAGVKAPSPHLVATWLRPLIPVGLRAMPFGATIWSRLTLEAPSQQHHEHVPGTFGPRIAAAARRIGLTVRLQPPGGGTGVDLVADEPITAPAPGAEGAAHA